MKPASFARMVGEPSNLGSPLKIPISPTSNDSLSSLDKAAIRAVQDRDGVLLVVAFPRRRKISLRPRPQPAGPLGTPGRAGTTSTSRSPKTGPSGAVSWAIEDGRESVWG